MRKSFVTVVAGVLAATAVIAAPVSAAEVTRTQLLRTGATASWSEVRDGLSIWTEVSVSEQAVKPNGAVEPLLWVSQLASLWDETTGEATDPVWAIGGVTSTFTMTLARDLSSAVVSTPELAIERCVAPFEDPCTGEVVPFTATFDGAGPLLHFRQNSIMATSGQSRFVAHGRGTSRFAAATVTIGSDTYGPSTGPVGAAIYDTHDGYIEAILVPFGQSVPLSAVGAIAPDDTTNPPSSQQSGQAVLGSFTRSEDGITVRTFVSGSSRRVLQDGTTTDQVVAFINEQVVYTDAEGNEIVLSDTNTVEEAVADAVTVDNQLRTGAFGATNQPALACGIAGDEWVCTATTISATLSLAGYGDVTRTMNQDNSGVAGYWVINYHRANSTRQATGTGTVDGADAGVLDYGRLELFRLGYRSITIRSQN